MTHDIHRLHDDGCPHHLDEVSPYLDGGEAGTVVHQRDDGTWCFWDETWSNEVGHYASEAAAKEAVLRYCREELGYEPTEQLPL